MNMYGQIYTKTLVLTMLLGFWPNTLCYNLQQLINWYIFWINCKIYTYKTTQSFKETKPYIYTLEEG
jgi:hypothetical protein